LVVVDIDGRIKDVTVTSNMMESGAEWLSSEEVYEKAVNR
jgi:hypothetical protein